MANLLTNANLQPLVNVEEKDIVSLAELLLSQEEQEQLVVKRQSKIATTKASRQTRSERLSKTKSASTSEKGRLHAPIQKGEQLRISKENEEKSRKNLQDWQAQQGKKRGESSPVPPRLDAHDNSDKKAADIRQNSIQVAAKLRPVVLGMLDFTPMLDSTGNASTATGNIIKINRAIRVLNTENLPSDIDTSQQNNLNIDYLDAYSGYINQVRAFLSSLDISNFVSFEEALSFLSIAPEATREASNTQLLLTILRDYAIAVENCSPRLFESDLRKIPGAGSQLATPVPGIEALRAVLKSDNAFDYLDAVLGDDAERSLKVLLYQISSELKLSYNASKYGTTATAARTLQAPREAVSIIPSSQSENNFFGLRSIPSEKSGGQTFLFPFERRDILPDDSAIIFDSAPDILERDITSDQANIYREVKTKAKRAFSSMASSIDTNDFSSDYAPSVGGFILILQGVTLPLLEVLTSPTQTDRPSTRHIVEFLLLTHAGKDTDVLAQLMLYLAALKEELARPSVSSNLSVSQRAKVIGSLVQAPQTSRFSAMQQSVIVRNASANLVTVPTNVSSLAKVSSFSPLATIGAITLQQTSTRPPSIPIIATNTANPGMDLVAAVKSSAIVASAASRAERLVNANQQEHGNTNIQQGEPTRPAISADFIEICEATAQLLFSHLSNVASTGNPPPNAVILTSYSIASALKGLVSTDDDGDVFISMLTLFDDFIEMYSTSDGSCFSSASITNYSGMSRGNIEISFYMCIAKLMFFLDNKSYTVAQNAKNSSTSVKIAMKTEHLTNVLEALIEAFDDDVDVERLSSVSPSLGRIVESLAEEEAFIATLPATLSEYFDNISKNFGNVKSMLEPVPQAKAISLIEKLNTGLLVSSDQAMSLKSLESFYNSSALSFSSFKALDTSLSNDAMFFLSQMAGNIDFLENKKIASIALPTGLCDSIYNIPVSLENITRDIPSLSKDSFEVVIEKIDLTRPSLRFKEKVFLFSRNMFFNSFVRTSDNQVELNLASFDESLSMSVVPESTITLIKDASKQEQLKNLKNDVMLKMYASLLYDLGFSFQDYPVANRQKELMAQKSSTLHYATDINLNSLSFLSGSNLAFDELDRAMPSFKWYNGDTGVLDFDVIFKKDAIAYSVWEYLSATGVVAYADRLKDLVSLGSNFERVLLVPFDPHDFEVEQQNFGDDISTINLANESLTLAQKEVGIGLETSQGVELSTFRMTIRIPGESNSG